MHNEGQRHSPGVFAYHVISEDRRSARAPVLRVEPKHDPRGGTIKRGGRYTPLVAKGSDKASDV